MQRQIGGARITIILMSLVSTLSIANLALAQGQVWIQQFGTASTDSGRALTPDGAGGVFFAGKTAGDLSVPHTGGRHDVFLCRYDGDGNRIWITQFGSSKDDIPTEIAPDGADGVFVVGYTEGDFGGPNEGRIDGFLGRVDSTGSVLWMRQIGGPYDDYAYSVASDGAGGAYVVGTTDSILGGSSAGLSDAYLAHYDAQGTQSWIKQFGTSAYDRGLSVVRDSSNTLFVAGDTSGDLAAPSAGSSDIYLARFSNSGDQIWVRQFGTTAHDDASGLALDGAGGVFLGGGTYGSLGGPVQGSHDCIVARFNNSGDQLWMKQFGSNGLDFISPVASDGAGGVFVAGFTYGNLGRLSFGGKDVYLAHYDGSGQQLRLTQIGTTADESCGGLAPSGDGDVFFAGWTRGQLGGLNSGGFDAFLARYTDACHADCDLSTGPGMLDIFDFICFQTNFVNLGSYACDCDTGTGTGVCDIFDFLCFQNAFVSGCP